MDVDPGEGIGVFAGKNVGTGGAPFGMDGPTAPVRAWLLVLYSFTIIWFLGRRLY